MRPKRCVDLGHADPGTRITLLSARTHEDICLVPDLGQLETDGLTSIALAIAPDRVPVGCNHFVQSIRCYAC
jgi:hypothetical protein